MNVSIFLVVFGAAFATAQRLPLPFPKIQGGLACSSNSLSILYASGFISTTTVPAPPSTPPTRTYPGPTTTTLSPVVTYDASNTKSLEIQHHHPHRSIFTCTAAWQDWEWMTTVDLPKWLATSGYFTATLNTYVTFTYLSTTQTSYYIHGTLLGPPSRPSKTWPWPSPLPTSYLLANVADAGEKSEKEQSKHWLTAHSVSPPITECATVRTAFVTVTFTETVTEAQIDSKQDQ